MHFGWKTRRLSLCVLAALLLWPAAPPFAAGKDGSESKKSSKSKAKPREEDDGETAVKQKDPTTFTEAMEQGKMALDQSQADAEGVRMLEEQKDTENLPKMRKDMIANEASAYRLLRLALALADKGKERPNIKDVNEVRYFLSYLNFQRGNYYDAAVMGEFLARTAPDTPEGRQGARFAMTAYRKLFAELKQPDKNNQFEIEHIQHIGEFIIKQWPKEEEALEAATVLLSFALNQHNLTKAVEYLQLLPEASPRRVDAELRVGQALWATYLKASLAPAAERPKPEELEQYRAQAEKLLSAAIERTRKQGQPTPTIVAAMLSLTQIYVDKGDNEKAVAILEDPQFGPLTLIKAKDPATSHEGFAVQTYIVALRAFVATQNVKNATKIMNSLDKRIGKSGDPKADQNLTQIYITLGRELQQHLERLRQSGNKKELESVSNAFESFLKRIVERGGGNSFSSLSWVAETFYSMAINFDEPSAAEVPEKAKGYYTNAVKGYEQILERAAKDPKFVPSPESLIGIRLRMAISERRVGHFNTAIKLISEVLQARPKMITAQIEGAETYQMKGATDKVCYLEAISGGEKTPHGDNLIWGWGKLAQMTMKEDKFQATFYQARLKIAECRYFYALKATDKAKHDEYMGRAKKEISVVYKLFPTLGGPESFAKYDELAKKVQAELSETPVGMQEFDEVGSKSAQVEK